MKNRLEAEDRKNKFTKIRNKFTEKCVYKTNQVQVARDYKKMVKNLVYVEKIGSDDDENEKPKKLSI